MSFNIPGEGQLDNVYVSDYWVIDKFLGDRLWNWGANNYGQLGDNTLVRQSSPVQTIAGGTIWKQVACGYSHTVAIKTDGAMWSYGMNVYGQLGDNTVVNKSSPVQTIAGGTNWKQVSAGAYHTAAIKTDGTLWSCGYGIYGQIGNNNPSNQTSPVQTVAGGTNWKQASCGAFHTAAIKTDGTLWTWGNNQQGQLGDGVSGVSTHKSVPAQTVAGGTNWKQVSCGTIHTAAIKTDGTLWLWGNDSYGRLGDNSNTNKSSPVQTVCGGTNWKYVNSGSQHTTAIKTDGTLWCWGANAYGQLGDNTRVHKSSPVQTIAGGTNWKQVACAYAQTAAIKTDGTLWTCGYNNNGQLGDNTVAQRSSPVQTIAGGANWKSVAVSQYRVSAISINNFNTTGAE